MEKAMNISKNFNYNTEEIRQKDKDHHVHPWTDFATFHKTGSMVVAESDGAYVFDSEGNKFLDGIGGLWCVNAGYGRDEIAQAMADQASRMNYYSSFGHHTSIPAAELAAKLAELTPGKLNHVLFGTGGSMANDTAVRIIHFYFNQLGKYNKKQIITRDEGYHGSTYMAMTLTGVSFDHQGFDLAPNIVHRVSNPNPYRCPNDMDEDAFLDYLVNEFEDKVLEVGPDNVAAFFAEPIMGAGGVIVPPSGYHKRIWEICKKNEILYVADEVVTAFGRLGHWFASEAITDIIPDIITSAKGISSAYAPLSATIISDKIYEVISKPQCEGGIFTHGFTYSGHPVCCAAGLKNIEIMEREDICGHVLELGPYLEARLSELNNLPIVGDIRGKCFMMCVENVANKDTKELLPSEAQVGNRIAEACEKRGVLVRPIGHLNVLSPPLILTREQVDFMVDVLRDGIVEVQASLKNDGFWNT